MEQSRAAVWTCLLGAGLALVLPPAMSGTISKTFPRLPRLLGCVFLNRANVTCRWEAGDAPTKHYTLQIQKKSGAAPITRNSSLKTFTCTTSNTSCTAGISGSSVRFTFCIIITAHTLSRDISSAPRCQPGRTEVMLPPVSLNSVNPVTGMPQCLSLNWSRTLSVFPMSTSEIRAGNLISQIEFTAQGQLDIKVQNVTVKNFDFLVCFFRPDTSYTVRLRHCYQGPESPWSPWSNTQQGRTGEDAPSAAPAFWRRVKHRAKNGWRPVLLLWKPLPRSLANGRVLFYNVTCQTESTQALNDYGNCRDLHHTSTSCSLLLPVGRCSCALTASNSAGTSPEAQIWLLGSSETKPPALSQITGSPLNDNNLDVRWRSRVDLLVTGFVLEWFAVRENNNSILYWERLNSSCTALVITEGIKPMERYAVSVQALYGEQGAGQNRTLYIYTVQGAPSGGPIVKVEQISSSTVELSWSPVAVELLHGFVRNYTLCYSTVNQLARSVFVPGHVRGYSLKNLLPGNYDIFMRANTDAGAGAAGPIINVHIDSEEFSAVMYAILPLMMTSLVLVLMACLAHSNMVKQKLCQYVPDPSSSSLAQWTPETTLESGKRSMVPEKSEIKHSEVVILGGSELQTCSSDQDISYKRISNLQTYSTHPVSSCQTPQNTRLSEMFIKSPTRVRTTSSMDLSSCSYFYSNVLTSQTLKNVPTPNPSPSHCHTVSINDVRMQLGGEKEPSEERPDSSQACSLLLKQYQIPLSLSDFSRISQSTILLSHTAQFTALKHPVPQSNVNSDTFTQHHPDASSDTFSTSFSPFRVSFIHFSYCPVECEPYIPLAV